MREPGHSFRNVQVRWNSTKHAHDYAVSWEDDSGSYWIQCTQQHELKRLPRRVAERHGRTATIHIAGSDRGRDADQFPVLHEVIAFAKANKLFDAADAAREIQHLQWQKEWIKEGSNKIEDLREQLKLLKAKLDNAQHLVIAMATKKLPHGTYSLLRPYDLKSLRDLEKWKYDAIESVVQLANVDNNGFAYCPLCGDGVSSFRGEPERGFRFPAGLAMHLEGSYRAHQCDVMRLAIEGAKDWDKFQIAALDEKIAKLSRD
jgi:hypothetical protein